MKTKEAVVSKPQKALKKPKHVEIPKKVDKVRKAKKVVNKPLKAQELNEETNDSEEDKRIEKRAERKSKLSSKLSSKLRNKVKKVSKKDSTVTLSTKNHDKIFEKFNIDETAYICFGNYESDHPECETCHGKKNCAKKTK